MEGLFFLGLTTLFAAAYLGYHFSPAARARSVAQNGCATLHAARMAVETEWDSCQNSLRASAEAYRDSFFRQQMAAVSVDDFKNHLGGLRLRAVRDAGLMTLLDLQGWTCTRLMSLRGVGEDTASGVAAIVQELSQRIRSTPVPFPDPNLADSNSANLFAQAAYVRQAQHLPAWIHWIETAETHLRAQTDAIFRNTTFGCWLGSLTATSSFKEALAASLALDESLKSTEELGSALLDCLNDLAAIQQIRSSGVVREQLVADARQNWAFYVPTIRGCILTDEPPDTFRHTQPESGTFPGERPPQAPAMACRAAPAPMVPTRAVSDPSFSGANERGTSHQSGPSISRPSASTSVLINTPLTIAQVGEDRAAARLAATAPIAPVPILLQQEPDSLYSDVPIPPTSSPHPLGPPNGGISVTQEGPRASHDGEGNSVHSQIPSRPVDAKTSPVGSRWIPIGTPTNVCGFSISAGGLHVGNSLSAVASGGPEPAELDPGLPLDRVNADYRSSDATYWPSYQGLSPKDRASYLSWLGAGMEDPEAAPTYVFLYFYGLERRALFDATTQADARAELPAIAARVSRLLELHQARNGSYHTYATAFLQLLAAHDPSLAEFASEFEESRTGTGASLTLKLALAQVALSRRGLPSHLALQWLRQDQNSWLRTPALRSPEVFGRLFQLEYDRVHPRGLKLPVNKTKLSITYQPASATFGREIRRLDVPLPDLTVLTKPLTELRSVAEICCEKLDSYSRFLGKNPTSGERLEALVLLPAALWPESAAAAVQSLRLRVEAASPLVLPLRSLFDGIGPFGATPTKAQYAGLGAVLESVGLGIEPDSRVGGAIPDLEDSVALFVLDAETASAAPSKGYAGATLLVQLASAIAGADGSVSSEELVVLGNHLDTALTLTPNERQRLLATVSRSSAVRRPLTGISKRIQGLGKHERATIGDFLVAIVRADGVVSPDEVKSLEKLWKLLELPMPALYSRLHGTEARPKSAMTDPTVASAEPRLHLDSARVASLKKESSDVAELLGRVFAEPPPDTTAVPQPDVQEEPSEPKPVGPSALLGLDQKHSDLLRTLYTRPEWPRLELEELCDERGLPVDGALERINEAAFDRFDMPLLEGDDPVTLNSELALEGI